MKLEAYETKVRPRFDVDQCAQPLSFTAGPEDVSFEIEGDGDGGVVIVDSSSIGDESWRSRYDIRLNSSGPASLASLLADAQKPSGTLGPGSRSSLLSICSTSPEEADNAGITLNAEKSQRHTSTTSSASTWSSASAPTSADASGSLRTASPLSTFLEEFPSPPSPPFSPHKRESQLFVDTLPLTYEELCSLPALPPSPELDFRGTPESQARASYCSTASHCPTETLAPAAIIQTCTRSMSSYESFLPSTTDPKHYTPSLNFPSRKHYSPSQTSSSIRSNTLSHSRSLPSVTWSSTGTAQSTWSGPSGLPHGTTDDSPRNLEAASFAPEHRRPGYSPGRIPPLLPPPTHLQPSSWQEQRDSRSLFDTVYEETATLPHSRYHSGTFPRRKEGSGPHTFHPPAPPSTRSTRSGTISSTNSGRSASLTTTKSAHPFANPVPIISPPSPSQHTTIILPHHYSQSNPHPHYQQRAMAPPIAYHAQPAHQVSLVSQEDSQDDDETCPICVESLGFSYRLPGEKPHVVLECGHSLHEACFVAVYGPVPRADGPRKLNLGVCGVCRKPMRIGDGDAAGGSNKLAMLMGTDNASNSSRGRIPPALPNSPSRLHNTSRLEVSPNSADLTADDVLEPAVAGSRSVGNEASRPPPRVVIPSISVRSEYPSISRIKDGVKGKQIITAVLSIDVPPAGDRGRYPAPSTDDDRYGPQMSRLPSSSGSEGQLDQLSPQLPPSPRSDSSNTNFAAGSSAVLVPPPSSGRHDAFAHVTADLKNRVADYKGHGLDSLGPIRMFDLLKVRKGSQIREFHVYLFQEALICVSEEKKKGLRGFLSSSSSTLSNADGTSNGKGVLKLKGRIFLRHVSRVFDSTVQGELSLTIVMEDETLDSFILTFKDRSSHETWRSNLTRLMEHAKGASRTTTTSSAGGTSKINRMMGAGAPVPASNGHSQLSPGSPFSPASTLSSSRFEEQMRHGASTSIRTASTFTNFTSSSPPAAMQSFQQTLAPVHTPIDLTIVLSVPSPVAAAASSAAALKTRLIRASLCFALSLMGPKDRISIVTCELGSGGSVRKTPLLAAARPESRRRLEGFVETIGMQRSEDDEDEFDVVMNEERQDVVAAVNVGLDVVLQRKSSNKNTLAGMILICDTAESIKRAQMDLVLARLEAANIPIHALGYGKAHDPSPLWMLSNNTNGSYTFVKEWYDLRDTLAGVIGGLMSIALTQMKVHLSCQDNEFKVHKISGATQAVVATNGKDVDIDLRELRHGERKEILVELEIDFAPDRSSASVSQRGSSDDLTHGLGINGLSVADSSRMYDEVPVIEVDCSFHDPAVGRSVARLTHPVLLTVAILPKATSPSVADPAVQRRKMELFASDMITRALLLASRRNWSQASRILTESKRMIHVVVQQLQQNPGAPRTKRESQVQAAVIALGAVMQDMDTLQEGLDDQRDLFDRDHRLYGAQQAMIMRGQKSWTTRTGTERLYCTEDTQQIIQLSGEWASRT